MAHSPAEDPLWSFATGFYAEPGMKTLCLRLQDEAGLDIPLLLTLLFAATRGGRLSPRETEAIAMPLAAWRRDVIENLRMARRAVRSQIDEPAVALARRILEAELDAERRYLTQLRDALPPLPEAVAGLPDILGCADANMRSYAALVPGFDEAAMASLRIVLTHHVAGAIA